ncbi:MAG: DUF86 domain-containing protein [Thiomonas sp.]|uniref:HepT-like ribonuclease domain-containing protein n=1 Tax=Thiomonas sp. TaxID=2047785 RepID=UPI002A35B425|nr:DUF86 domain-containing protein [Thiomonas sp.]MDY0329782.1 DUF86 domain-containing protein [Thiomonas sp.]
MSEAPPREWRFYLEDMIGFAEKVLVYTQGLDQAGFEASGLNYDATLRNLELIGEAATHIPEPARQAHPEIPWRMVIATRNRLIHGYLGIDNDTLWSIIQDDVPKLLQQLKSMREKSE